MELIDENHGVGIIDQLFHDGLQTLFELTAVFRARDDERQIQHQDALLREKRRDFSVNDPLRQPFHDSGLSNARVSDENRIVLRSAAQDLDHSVDFRIASDQRVQNPVHGGLRQVARKLAEQRRFLGFNQRLTVHNRARQLFTDRVQPKAALVKNFRRDTLFFPQNSKKEVLGADVAVIQTLRLFGRIRENTFALGG